jgi:hypothetical protein
VTLAEGRLKPILRMTGMGRDLRRHNAISNVRFDILIAQSRRSAFGHTKPPAERSISDQFHQKRTDRSPPKADLCGVPAFNG